MQIDLYQVDAFASKPFEGNPAAVCPLDEWLSDAVLQKIAMENNLSETAFFVRDNLSYHLRWFTPQTEVDLCGHATLASAHVLFEHRGYEKEEILFNTNSGELRVRKEKDLLIMDFPAAYGDKVKTTPPILTEALGIVFEALFKADDYMLVVEHEQQIRELTPNFLLLKEIPSRGFIVTAPGDDAKIDFVSRFFAPAVGINEDPVTGSAHTMMTPYWADRLGKKDLSARQISSRGGNIWCSMDGVRVKIAGHAITYLQGSIDIDFR